MIPVFIEYLATKNHLPLLEMGELRMERIPAQIDVPGRQIIPPASLLSFHSTPSNADELINWLAVKLGLDQKQAELNFTQFIKNWQVALKKDKLVSWKGLGTWQANEEQVLSFQPEMNPAFEGLPVQANKVLRENVEHQVRVGEEHRSSIEMTALLNAKGKKITLDLWLGVAALLLLVVFWSLHLWKQPVTPESFSNLRQVFSAGAFKIAETP